ncbi:MAG: low-specificity L-threonine aldolase [Firmicutes bacterium]|nr:low-specificity L-threonine aldolase [Bacillota bacterium]
MRKAMAEAEVGDDVYGEDPTVNRLEELAAAMLGKEASLFVTSGTMGNQVAIMTHTRRGDEIIVESEAHVFMYEAGGAAVLSGVQVRQVKGEMGLLGPTDVEAAIREIDIHAPRSSLLCIENTHNRAGGTVVPPKRMGELYEVCRKHGLAVHLDGARVFNASVALGVDVREITKWTDSVQLCLSKGLCAPVGSIVAGTKEWVEAARKNRKMLGGGMRQAGVIAAAGIVALEKMVDRLAEDHENARFLAEALSGAKGLSIDMKTVQTNMVYVDVSGTGMTAPQFEETCAREGVRFGATGPAKVRLVTHHDVSRKDVEDAIVVIEKVAEKRL